MYKIAVSVICYDNEEEVLDFADKLSRQKDSEKIVLLVTCNKCMNVKKLINDLNEIKISSQIFEPGENLGYLHGCLYGFKEFARNMNGLLYQIQILILYQIVFFKTSG